MHVTRVFFARFFYAYVSKFVLSRTVGSRKQQETKPPPPPPPPGGQRYVTCFCCVSFYGHEGCSGCTSLLSVTARSGCITKGQKSSDHCRLPTACSYGTNPSQWLVEGCHIRGENSQIDTSFFCFVFFTLSTRQNG